MLNKAWIMKSGKLWVKSKFVQVRLGKVCNRNQRKALETGQMSLEVCFRKSFVFNNGL